MTEEVIANNAPEASDLGAAEASLENALASIKGNKAESFFPTDPEPENEPEVEASEPQKRETLKLPEKPEKKFVETDEPEVQRRINELYKESRVANERNSLLQDELLKVAQRSEEREAFLISELNKIQNRHTQQDNEATLSDLRKQYNDFIQNFDYENAAKINEKIVDFKTEEKLNAILNERKVAENNQKQQVRRQQPVYSDPQDVADADRFQTEKASDGSLARPWLQPNHPEFQNVVDVMAAISNGFIRKGQRPSLSAVMSQVDKYMGLGNQQGSPNQGQAPSPLKHAPVLSSNTALNVSPDNQANKISDLERSYATKLGVSEKDYMRLRKFSSSGPISMDNFKK